VKLTCSPEFLLVEVFSPKEKLVRGKRHTGLGDPGMIKKEIEALKK
jgi:hypothetical protein